MVLVTRGLGADAPAVVVALVDIVVDPQINIEVDARIDIVVDPS